MPTYDVMFVIVSKRTYRTTVTAENDGAAETEVQTRVETLLNEGKALPETFELDEEEVELEDVEADEV